MTTDTQMLGPIASTARIQAMDVLRGYALLGILLMNMEGFVGPLMASISGLNPTLTGADAWVDSLIFIFVQGKFYTLFSLLFGMGFAVMMQRALASGRPFAGIYLRRTIVLLMIGLIHAIFIWAGDILVSYALVAFALLLFFRNTPQTRLPKWGIFFALLPGALMIVFGLLTDLAKMNPEVAAQIAKSGAAQQMMMDGSIASERTAYGSGSYMDAIAQRWETLKMMMGFLVFFGANILGMFLLGAWFVRSGAISRPNDFSSLYSKLRWLAFPAGLAMVVWAFWMQPTKSMAEMSLQSGFVEFLHFTGSLLMCLGYVAWVIKGLQSSSISPRLALLAPAGRMALSNYLTQSIVCTLIFYSYGLGYFEQLPRAWQLPFAVAFWSLQLLLSRWWLARYTMGPAEYVWRWLTYGKQPKFVS